MITTNRQQSIIGTLSISDKTKTTQGGDSGYLPVPIIPKQKIGQFQQKIAILPLFST